MNVEDDALGQLLELGLSTGWIRGVRGPQAEQAAGRLHRRTPQGLALAAGVAEANAALAGLAGQPLRTVSVAARWPGSYDLTLETLAGRVLLRLDGEGVVVRSVEVGLDGGGA